MAPVSGALGPPIPAWTAGTPFDETAGECTSEVVTTFVRPLTTLKAVFYFPWHHDPAVHPYWPACVVPDKDGFQPQAGFYSSLSNTVIAQHMATMASKDANVVGLEWKGRDKYEDQNALRAGGVLDGAASEGLKVALLYDLTLAHDGRYNVVQEGEEIKQNFRHFRDKYFNKDGEPRGEYLRIDGKPVVYLYVSRELFASGGDPLRIQSLFNEIRAEVGGLYLVADHLWFSGTDFETLRQIGAQAVSAFHAADRVLPDGTSMPTLTSRFINQYYSPAHTGLLTLNEVNIHPGVFPQYDDRSTVAQNCPLDWRDTQNYPLSGVAEWQDMLKRVGSDYRYNVKKVHVRRDCSENVLVDRTGDPSIVWVYSFNEWAEGSGIEPVQDVAGAGRYPWNSGSDLINALRDHDFSANGSPVAQIPVNRGPSGPQGPRPNFAWDGVQNAESYQLHVTRAENGTVVMAQEQGGTIYVPSVNLDPGLEFKSKVRAKVGGTWQAWSEEKSFTTGPEVPITPTAGCISMKPKFRIEGNGVTWNGSNEATAITGGQIWFSAEPWTALGTPTPRWDEGTGLASNEETQLRGMQVSFKYPSASPPQGYTVYFTTSEPGCEDTRNSDAVTIHVTDPPAWLPEVQIDYQANDGVCQLNEGLSGISDDCDWDQPPVPEPDCGASTVSWTSGGGSISEFGTASAQVRLNTPHPLQCPVSVNYATIGGSANSQDFVFKDGTITFPLGSLNASVQTVSVGAEDDIADEANETFSINLSNPENAEVDGSGAFGITIGDNDPAPSASVFDTQADENAGPLSFLVRLSTASGKTVQVSYSTSSGTASPGADYANAIDTLTFSPGEIEKRIDVSLVNDSAYEPGETVILTLDASANATLTDTTATGMILENDFPVISIAGTSATEGAGPVPMTFTITRSPADNVASSVRWSTASGTSADGAESPADFTAVSNQILTFAPFEAQKQITVTVAPDALYEAPEVFTVNLSSPTKATIGVAQATGTILDDDPKPVLSIGDASVGESAGTASVTVTLAPVSGAVTKVRYAAADGTAKAGFDYQLPPGDPGELVFQKGETTKVITVSILQDAIYEAEQSFTVALDGAVGLVGATIGDGQALISILDDDVAPSRVFLAMTGSDDNDCSSTTTPCRTFGGAADQVADSGEIIVLGSGAFGSFGPAGITRPVKVHGSPGAVVLCTSPVIVNLGGLHALGTVVFRSITFKAPTPGTGTAIAVTGSGSVLLESVAISDWSVGLSVGSAAHVSVNQSTFRLNGVGIQSTAAGAELDLAQTAVALSATGIDLQAGSASIVASQLFGNSTAGIAVGAGALASINTSQITANGSGINVASSGTARLARSTVAGNVTGISNSGLVESTGKSIIKGNTTNVSGAPLVQIPGQ
jgi:hypothetical protein